MSTLKIVQNKVDATERLFPSIYLKESRKSQPTQILHNNFINGTNATPRPTSLHYQIAENRSQQRGCPNHNHNASEDRDIRTIIYFDRHQQVTIRSESELSCQYIFFSFASVKPPLRKFIKFFPITLPPQFTRSVDEEKLVYLNKCIVKSNAR